jgi:diguanylate cyclase (GGDEF)-like protein/PAS domain S-box-containing protein
MNSLRDCRAESPQRLKRALGFRVTIGGGSLTTKAGVHEQPLRPSDVGLGHLFNLIQEAVIVADTEANQILLWNEGAQRMFGYTEYEALSMPLEDLVPTDIRERHLNGIRSFNKNGPGPLIRSGKPVELNALRKDGSTLRVELSLTALQGAGTRASCVMAPIGVFMTDGSGEPIYANDEAQRLLGGGILPGVTSEELSQVYQSYRSGTDDLYESTAMPLVRALSGEVSSVDDMEVRRPDGTSSIEVWGTPIFDSAGAIQNAVAVFVDISSRRDAEKALRESEERFRQAFDHAPIGIALVSLEGRFLRVNTRLCELLSLPEEELLTKNLKDLTHPDDLDGDVQNKEALIAGDTDSYEVERRYLLAGDRTVWVLLSISIVRDSQGKPIHFIAQNQDITERKILEQQLLHEASHDPLTNLWNRRRFEEEVGRHLQEADRYGLLGSLLFIDLDHFKEVNDTYGHHVGDKALQKLTEVLQRRFRVTDTVGRLGGDEFAVLLPRVDQPQAEEIATDLAAALAADPLIVGDQAIHLRSSTGIATYGEKGISVTELLVRADRSMYEAKHRRAKSSRTARSRQSE